MKKVKLILIGIGGYGGTFLYEMLDNPCEKIEVVGLVEPYPERCKRLDDINEKNIPIYSSMEEIFKEKEADLTVISTPIFLHAKHIIEALENGSNVVCEKPLCGDARDIDKIEAAAAQANKFVYIGYQWAYSDAVTALKKDIHEGKFGNVLEMKSLVLRPRTRAYFGRGVGWAGKIKAPDGSLVYDSIANNSAAHYLFDMLFVTGDYGYAAEPEKVEAELLRANDIENFDTSRIKITLENGAELHFIGAHPVSEEVGPLYEYKFEKGSVFYANFKNDRTDDLMPEEYSEYGNIVAIMNDGQKIVYGNPGAASDTCRKVYMAVDAILNGDTTDGPCGVKAAAVHTRVINEIQEKVEILDIKQSFRKEKDDVLYIEGLFEALVGIYKNPKNSSIADFAE